MGVNNIGNSFSENIKIFRYKLYALHILSGNNVEAALTLKKHATLLKWTHEKLEQYLITKNLNRKCNTQMQLKEKIYIEVKYLFGFYNS